MGLAGLAAVGLQANYNPETLLPNGPTASAAALLRQNNLLASVVGGSLEVDRSDAATARAVLAEKDLLGRTSLGPLDVVQTVCRLPGVTRAALHIEPGAGALVMLDTSHVSDRTVETVRRLVNIACGFGSDQLKVVNSLGQELGAAWEYQNEVFYRNSDPAASQHYQLSAQIIADEVFGSGASKVLAAAPRLPRRRLREVQPGVRTLVMVNTSTQEQRDKLLEQMRLRLNYSGKKGDVVSFVGLPYRLQQLKAKELELLQRGLSAPPRPWSYSMLLGLAAFAPAGLCWGLISYDLLRRHQVRSSG